MRKNESKDNIRRFWSCEKYATFLKQPLTLGIFVPCDEDGFVLEEPAKPNTNSLSIDWLNEQYNIKMIKYQQAKERVLFEINDLPPIDELNKLINTETVEMLADGTITLTQSAIKKLGL